MTVIVDEQPLAAEKLGLQTIGAVLDHLQGQGRLVVHLLIDGNAPDLNQLETIRKMPLSEHTLFVETSEAKKMAGEVLREMESLLEEAEQAKKLAVQLLQSNQPAKALEHLGWCFTIWHQAQDAVQKTAQLLGLSLESMEVEGTKLPQLIEEVTAPLRQVKSALESRDFVLLNDTLAYEMPHITQQWQTIINTVRSSIK